MSIPLRVLIAEDSEDDALLTVRELKHGGYEVKFERVDTAEAMRAALDRQAWDVVIADYAMPHFSAPAALALLQQRGLDLPFIIVSGTIGEDTAVAAMKAGAHDYLMKGNLKRLVPTVEREVREAQVRRERKQAQEALRESRERLNSILQSLQDVVWSSSLAGEILYLSPAAERIYGRPAADFFQNPQLWLKIVHPEDRAQAERGAQALLENGSNEMEYRIVRPDGEARWVHARGWVVRDANGTVIRMDGLVSDITERKRAEEALRQSEERYRLLAESALTGVYLIQDNQFRYVNSALASIFGYGVEEVAGKLGPMDLTASDDRALVAENLRKRVQDEVRDIRYSFRGLRKDGKLIDVEVHGARIEYEGRPAVIGTLLDVTERKRAEQAIQLQLQRLAALRDIDMAISASLDLRISLNVLLDKVTTQLRVDAADILLLNPHTQVLEHAAGRGFRTAALQHTHLRLGEGHAGRAALERRTVSIPNLAEAEDGLRRAPLLAGEGFIAYHGVPLLAKGQVKGVLEVFHRAPLAPDPEWLDFLETLAGQAAIAIDNASLFDDLQRSNVELALAYDATLEGWSRALDLRDKETEGHTQRVVELTARLARAMGMSDDELAHVRRGALLHDMGKMGIPDAILLKPGALTEEEWVIMRKHPAYAYEMLSPIPYLRPALDIPYCHHEKWDGSGYPRGLKGEEIPLAARVFAIADVWDALRSDRPYRPAWPDEKALGYIREQAGKHFDPKVVKVFLGVELQGHPIAPPKREKTDLSAPGSVRQKHSRGNA